MREILLFVIVFISLPIAWRKPLYGIMFYLGFNVVRPEVLFWGTTNGSYVFKVYYGVLILAIFSRGYIKNIKFANNPTMRQVLLFCLAVPLSLLFSDYSVNDYKLFYMYEIFKILGLCLILFLVVNEVSSIYRIQTVFIGCFSYIGLLGIQQHFSGNPRLEGLMGSGWGDSNGIAAMFVMFVPVAMALYFNSKQGYMKNVKLFAVIVLVILIICTKSRGGLLGLCFGVAAFGYYSRQLKKVIVLGLLAMIFALPFVSDSYMDRLRSVQNSEGLDTSARSRFVLWKAGLMVFKDNPLLGSGFLSYPDAKMAYRQYFYEIDDGLLQVVFDTRKKLVTHSAYIQVLSDLGLVGAVPFFFLFVGGAVKGIKVRKNFDPFYEKRKDLVLLSGICAGLTGFAFSVITIDAMLCIFIYTQAVFATILYRSIFSEKRIIV